MWALSAIYDMLAKLWKSNPPKTPKLFDPNLVYPSDEVGPHVDLEGIVIGVGVQFYPEYSWDEVPVLVKTEYGNFTGYTSRPPKAGYRATIRVYNSGGGWYPDDRIIGWTNDKERE